MKFWHISDTHGLHWHLDIPSPDEVDGILFTGDMSNQRDPYLNKEECITFLEWVKSLPYKYKIGIPGNHDTSIEKGLITKEQILNDYDFILLVNESITVEGIKIYGSPVTPTFGFGWAYNAKQNKINKFWSSIPKDTEILLTHGPPKELLDTTRDFVNAGCKHLYNTILTLPKLKYSLFGHIHEDGGKILKTSKTGDVQFINGSIVNLRCTSVEHNGFIIEV